MLSTIILNWNRAFLLRQCVESYLETVCGDYELIVVDNASRDGSIPYIEDLERKRVLRAIYLNENQGGEAFNFALRLTRGELIHLSENDQLFLPGWREHVDTAFEYFEDLGQLSLFNDTPTDNEAWEPKPSHLRFAKGKILYEAHGNVGTSSVIRRCLFREFGIKIENFEAAGLKFPNDGKLSADIRAAGFWCAWSDRYYVRNIGHELAEFERDPDYYRQNCCQALGWRNRLEEPNPPAIRSTQTVANLARVA